MTVKIFHEIVQLPDFERDLKKLSKRFRTLPDDLQNFIQTELNLYHKLKIDNGGIFQIPGLSLSHPKIYKAKKFACRSLKGRGAKSGIRLIYDYFEEADRIELVELYFKGDKENEDKARIIRIYNREQGK